MRTTAVYASFDAEGVEDIDREAAMSGYKCPSCGEGTIALSAADEDDDHRFCVHCGATTERVKDVSELDITKRLLEAEESSLVAIKCPHCLHKSISERAALHKNHLDEEDGKIKMHCTECGSALTIEASAVPLDDEEAADAGEFEGSEEADADESTDEAENDDQQASADDESADDSESEEADADEDEEEADAEEAEDHDDHEDEDEDSEEEEDEDDEDMEDEEEDFDEDEEASADDEDESEEADADEEEADADDEEDAGANKNRDRRQSLKEALEEEETEDESEDEAASASIKKRQPVKRKTKPDADTAADADEDDSEEADTEEANTHYIRMGDNSAEIGFMDADDKTLSRVHRVMSRFPRLKVTKQPAVRAGKIHMAFKGRKSKSCVDAMRREFGNIFDYADAQPKPDTEEAMRIRTYDDAEKYGPAILTRTAKVIRSVADELESTAQHKNLGGEDYALYASDVSPWIEMLGDMGIKGMRVPRKLLQELNNLGAMMASADEEADTEEAKLDSKGRLQKLKRIQNLLAKLEKEGTGKEARRARWQIGKLVKQLAEARVENDTEARDLPAIALVEEGADVSFASNGEHLFCMAGDTCIAKLAFTGNVKEMTNVLLDEAEKSSLREALEAAKFELVTTKVEADKASAAEATRIEEEASAKMEAEVAKLDDVAKNAIQIATTGVNRGFFDSANPLAEKLVKELAEAGMEDSDEFVAEVFDEVADDYAEVLSEKAAEIMRKPEEVRSELASTIATVRHRTTGRPAKPEEKPKERASAEELRSRLSKAMKPSTRVPEVASGESKDKPKKTGAVANWAETSPLGGPAALRAVK